MTYSKEQLIVDLGLQNMSEEFQNKMVALVYSTLNLRMSMVMADKLSDEQLDHFNQLVQMNDEAAAAWLETTVPNYAEVMEAELQTVLAEIKQDSQELN